MATTTTTTRYQIDDFETILYSGGVQFELPSSVMDIISRIASQVGASDYVRTPSFPKKTPPHQSGGGVGAGAASAHHTTNRRKAGRNQEINDDDWDVIRNFQTTELKKKEGIEATIGNIVKILNKISEKTYNKLFLEMCDEITKIEAENTEYLNRIGETIFNIASSNSLCSELYARLFKGLISRHDFIRSTFISHFDKFSEIFTSIEYCDPDENYDHFCEINAANSKRRALSMFYVNLMKQGVISNDKIIAIINNIQAYLMEKVAVAGNKEIVDELSEIIYIFVTNSNDELEDEDDWDDIVEAIEAVSKLQIKDSPSFTNKTKFKHMDILDEI